MQRFAGAALDPVAKMETRARALALAAMDKGWSGPPFDPTRLAELLGYEVETRADVPEARVLYQENARSSSIRRARPAESSFPSHTK